MLYSFLSFLNRIIPAKEVFAHCDIPCGIYTPEPAQTAARTVVRMVELMEELEPPNVANFNIQEAKGKLNSMARYVHVKEQHAQLCKEQLLILWTDYFKTEHSDMFPHMHETFWKATKLCSKAKHEVSMETAQELKKVVDEIAEMFQKAEAVKKK